MFTVAELHDLMAALRQGSPVMLTASGSVRRRLLRRYLDASQRNVPLHLVALAVLLFGVLEAQPWLPRSVAFALLAPLLLLRWRLAERALLRLRQSAPVACPTRAHDLLLLLALLGWSMSPWLVTVLSPQTDFFALCFVAVVAGGLNATSYLSALPASVVLVTAALAPLAASMAWHGGVVGWTLALGTALTLVGVLLRLRVNHSVALRMLLAERQNKALIEQLQRMQQQLALENQQLGQSLKVVSEAATRDALTGAFNRKYLDSIAAPLIERIRDRDEPVTVCMIDVDHFKRINDTHGHAFGDQVLKGVVTQLKARLRAVDRLARYGGEEFIVLLRHCDITRGRRVAETLREQLAALRFESPRHGEVSITVSVGVARWRHDETLGQATERADHALYRAKHGGRDRVEVHDDDVQDVRDGAPEPTRPAPLTQL